MRLLFILLLGWVCGWSSALQQRPHARGPWRVVYQLKRVEARNTFEGLGASANDTATMLQRQRIVMPASWNENPDSIVLLRNCENALVAPPPGVAIQFVATGASLRFDLKKQRLLLVPVASVVVLRAFQRSKRLFTHTLAVQPATHFTIQCTYSNNPNIVWEHPRSASERHLLSLRVIPAQEMADILPADARYRIAQIRASLRRQRQVVTSVVANSNKLDLNGWSTSSQPGDSLVVEVLAVERLNFQGRMERLSTSKQVAMLY